MEKAVFGAKSFFSEKAFILGVRGIDDIRISYLKEKKLEVVEIWFNPWKVSYEELLELFFDLHDPTTGNQYFEKCQSVVFFSNVNQLKAAKQKKSELKKIYKDIVTEITPIGDYYSEIKGKKLIS